MPYTEKQFPFVLLNNTDSESLRDDYQAALVAAGATQLAKSLAVSAYISFIIPLSLEADYNAADQAKKEVMAQICRETLETGDDFDTTYIAKYTALYP